MDFGTTILTEYLCEDEVSPGCTGDATEDPCLNPFYALDNPAICDAIAVSSLRLEPSALTITKGRRGTIRVVATFSNGQEGVVTDEAVIETGDDGISKYLTKGVVSGADAGATWVEAIWNGMAARGTITVIDNPCVADTGPWDVVFILDQAVGSTLLANRQPAFYRSGVSGVRIEAQPHFYWQRVVTDPNSPDFFDEALWAFQHALSLVNAEDPSDPGLDRLALVVTGDGEPRVEWGWSNVVRDEAFGGSLSDARLGAAVERARILFQSARPEARKLCVLLTCGSEWSCNPPLFSAAAALKAEGVELAIVSPVGPYSQAQSTCTYPQTTFAYLQNAASPCLMFGNSAYVTLSNVLAGVTAEACGGPCASSGL